MGETRKTKERALIKVIIKRNRRLCPKYKQNQAAARLLEFIQHRDRYNIPDRLKPPVVTMFCSSAVACLATPAARPGSRRPAAPSRASLRQTSSLGCSSRATAPPRGEMHSSNQIAIMFPSVWEVLLPVVLREGPRDGLQIFFPPCQEHIQPWLLRIPCSLDIYDAARHIVGAYIRRRLLGVLCLILTRLNSRYVVPDDAYRAFLRSFPSRRGHKWQ